MSVLSVKIWEDSEIAGRRSNWVRSPWRGTICRRMNLATEGRVYEIEVVIEHSLRGEGLQRNSEVVLSYKSMCEQHDELRTVVYELY